MRGSPAAVILPNVASSQQIVTGIGEIRPIEEIECFNAELKIGVLSSQPWRIEILQYGEIDGGIAWAS